MQEDISIQLNKIKETIDKYKGKSHILTPIPRKGDLSEITLPPYTKIAVRTVWISPSKQDGEVYELYEKPGDLILTKIGLQLLGSAAGISWSDLELFVNDSESLVAAASIKGTILGLDGVERSAIGRSSLDLRDGSAQSKKKKPGQLAVARSSILSLVETGAKNKVRRELLGVQGSYKLEDLEKPFILFNLVPDQEKVLNDYPALRQAIALKQIGISDSLFRSSPLLLEAAPEPLALPLAPEEVKSKIIQSSVDEIVASVQPLDSPNQLPESSLTPRGEQIIRIEALYQQKLGTSRSASKPLLSDLKQEELDATEAALMRLKDKVKK